MTSAASHTAANARSAPRSADRSNLCTIGLRFRECAIIADPADRRLAWAAAVIVAVPNLTSFRVVPDPSFWQNLLALALPTVVASILALQSLRERQVAWRIGPVEAFALAFSLLLFVQYELGRFTYASDLFAWLAGFCALGCAAAIGRRALKHDGFVTMIAATVLVVGLINALVAALQVAGWDLIDLTFVHINAQPRPGGFMWQPNQLGAWLCIAIVALVRLRIDGRLRIAPSIVAAVILLLAIAATGSRANWIYLGIALPMFGLFCRDRRSILSGWRMLVLAPFALVAAELIVAQIYRGLGIDAALAGSRGDGASLAARASFFVDGLRIWLAHPILGAGFGEFLGERTALDPSGLEINAIHSHNVLSNLLAETGLAGFAIALVATLWLLRGAFEHRTTVPRDAAIRDDRRFLGGALLVVALYSGSEFPLWVPHLAVPAAMMAGALGPSIPRGMTTRSARAAWAIALFVAVASMFAAAIDYRRIDRIYASFVTIGERPQTLRPREQDVLGLWQGTLFQREADYALLRFVPEDDTDPELRAAIGRRLIRKMLNEDVLRLSEQANLIGGSPEQAASMFRLHQQGFPDDWPYAKADLEAWASQKGDFIQRQLDEALSLQTAAADGH